MTITDQELETFLDEIFQEEPKTERRPLPKLTIKKPRKWMAIWISAILMATFFVGLFMGVALASSSQKKLEQIQEQLAYIVQKIADVEENFSNSQEIIEPLQEDSQKIDLVLSCLGELPYS